MNEQTEQETLICKWCGQSIPIVRWDWPGRNMDIVTCKNPDCDAHNQTITVANYPNVDLDKYRRENHV